MRSILEELSSAASRCALCGFCQAVCPTFLTTGMEQHGPRGRILIAGAIANGEVEDPSFDPFYTCLGCGACYYACPAGMSAWEVSRSARRLARAAGREDPLSSAISSAIASLGDPLGLGRRELSRWSRGLGIPGPRDLPGRPILLTGHMYQLMPYVAGLSRLRARLEGAMRAAASIAARVPRALSASALLAEARHAEVYDGYLRNIAALLRAAGVEFAYDPDEPYPGTLLHELGHDEEFADYARAFAGRLRRMGVGRVITVDPHTYDLLDRVYPRYVDGFDVEVLHYSELLEGLELRRLDVSVALHEPCHLVLRDRPLRSLEALLGRAAELRIPPRSGRRNFCCGGPAELLRGRLAEEVSRRRFEELKGLGSDLIVTACPICHLNLNKDGSAVDASEVLAASAGLSDRVRVPRDLLRSSWRRAR